MSSGDGEAPSGCASPTASRLLRSWPSDLRVLRWTTGTTRAPFPSALPAPTVLRLWLVAGHAPEQRLDRGTDFFLHKITDHGHETLLSPHRLLPSGVGYTKARSPAKSAAQRPAW